MNRRMWCTYSAVAVLVLAAGCASGPRAERYTAMPAGSTWTTQVRNSGSYNPGPSELQGKVVQVTWKGQQHTGFMSGPNTTVAAPTGDWITQLAPDGKPLVTWDPPIGFDWPLEVGKTWSRSFKMTIHSTNQSFDIASNGTVEAYEDVTVPAGTFKTFRVHVTNNFGGDETFWYSPEHGIFVKQVLKRTDKSTFGVGIRETELKSVTVAR
jgi:hypothetical protein